MRALSFTMLFGLGELAPVQRRALAMVYASSLALMMGVNFIQPALPAMKGPLGVSDAAVGMVMSVYTAPAIFLAPLLGIVADLYGRRLLLAGGLIIFGLAGASIAFAESFRWVLILRAIQGIGFSAVLPLTIVLIGDLLEGDREVGGQGLKVFLDRVGYLIFPPLGGVLAAIAWFWPFTLYIVAVPLGLLVLFSMPETKSKGQTQPRAYLREILCLPRSDIARSRSREDESIDFRRSKTGRHPGNYRPPRLRRFGCAACKNITPSRRILRYTGSIGPRFRANRPIRSSIPSRRYL